MQTTALQGLGAFPVALIIFAGIAIFLILRLRSVLGRRIGFEKPPIPPGRMPGFGTGPIIEGQAIPPQSGRAVPDPRSALGERLMQIVNLDPNFDPPKFLAGAETAFRMIVTAFAAGDRATLRNTLSGTQAAIIVRFVSDQVNVTLDSAGNPVLGNEAITEIVDLWTFERALKSQDPTWRLAAARSG